MALGESTHTQYLVRFRDSLVSPAFSTLRDALQWVRQKYPGASFDLDSLNGHFILAIYWRPDSTEQMRLGSIWSV